MELNEEDKQYFNVAIATSLVLFGFDGEELKILIYEREQDPFKGARVLPSTYIKANESVEDCVEMLIDKHTGVEYSYIEQLKAFTKVFRNPMGRVVNVAYYALVRLDEELLERTNKKGGIWVNYGHIPELAFDHNDIINYAKERLKRRVKRRPIGFFLLPKYFTISQLQKLYELALNKDLDKRNFRKKLFKSQLILETEYEDTSKRKTAKLYKFDEDKYNKQIDRGYDFLF